ncbi:MAG: c-type cytochrome [Xanthomonadales bacterium]|nr:c-type cytochrome [Xanthomonadales bacterium]NNL03935.1 c-type cytochrome [Xanthomonadales bacterium]
MIKARAGMIAATMVLCGSAAAADLEALKAECSACHGPLGVSAHSDVPIIAGQKAKFIAKTLRGFQMWDRPCIKNDYRSGPKQGTTTDMCKIASTLSDEDINALAAWYGEQTFVPAEQAFDPALATAGQALHDEHCETCHEQGGRAADRGPRLAGQWTDYLASTIKFVPTGEHLVPPMMERRVTDYSKQELEQLLNYYASQQDNEQK